ncbi:lysozyme inhibitor LprI family protein [Phenylobacterium sp.]|jgi:uncharacterized protein YecT (DUF1311 family)|uniref:lysozyme inhibitor LprI family protein n=1 Tax=Phenylobacterium sp. TaxID=1871053 RepID=UPI003783994D
MANDPIGETYNGFAGRGPEPAAKPPRRLDRRLILGGVAGALVLGLGLGLLSRPQFVEPADRRPMQPVTPVPVEVLAPAPQPMPKVAGRLEVLPPDMARQAAAAPVVRAPAAPDTGEPVVARAPMGPPVGLPEIIRAPRRASPSFDCGSARTQAEAMVCADPDLAAADRRLSRAYERAIDAGVPRRELRAEQDDWLAIREDAARRSPDAVASIYEQRTRELNDLAEEGWN